VTKQLLEEISPGLADRLRNVGEGRLLGIAATVAEHAVRSVDLHDPRVDRALRVLRREPTERNACRDAVEGLVAELDSVAWDQQEQAEAKHPQEQDYVQALEGGYGPAFARARAANAVACALNTDPLMAAVETIYEGSFAIGDREVLRRVVSEALNA
jgi:hypothetical protein